MGLLGWNGLNRCYSDLAVGVASCTHQFFTVVAAASKPPARHFHRTEHECVIQNPVEITVGARASQARQSGSPP